MTYEGRFCSFCKERIGDRVALNNNNEKAWIHLECYIEEYVRLSILKLKEMD